MKLGDTGYPYAIKIEKDLADSFFTLHPKLEGKNTREVKGPLLMLATEMSAKDEGTISYMYDDENGKSREKIVVFKKTPSWGWTVAGGTWIDEYNKNAAAMRFQLIAVCLIGAVVSALAAWVAANRGLAGVLPVAEGMRRLGAGDFSQSIPDAACEVGVIAQEANTARINIGALIRNISRSSGNAFSSAKTLEHAAETVASSAAGQSDSAAELAAAVEELSVSISHTADQTSHSANAAGETLNLARQGMSSASAVSLEMRKIAEDGVTFRSPIDGAKVFLSPEISGEVIMPSPLLSPAISPVPIVPSPSASPAISGELMSLSPFLSPAISEPSIIPFPFKSPVSSGEAIAPSLFWSPVISLPSITPLPLASPAPPSRESAATPLLLSSRTPACRF